MRYNKTMMSAPTLSHPFARFSFFALLSAPLLLAGAVALLPVRGHADPPANDKWDESAKPLLQTYCLPCHDDKRRSGGASFAAFLDKEAAFQNPEMGRKILARLHDRDMPPPNAKQLSSAEHDALSAAVAGLVSAAPAAKTPGRVVLHRLNRAEYNNSVRDLLGVNLRPADAFPVDGAGGAGFDNNADTLFLPPLLMEQYLDAAQTLAEAAPASRLFFVKPDKKRTPTQTAQIILERFAFRAFRRPLQKNESAPLIGLYQKAIKSGKSHENAVRFALRAVLVSPSFLFRAEQEQAGGASDYPLSDYEMASRLSYFLWSSLPDERLLNLAKQKKLHDNAVLSGEVVRMLKSPKAAAFADGFAGQWLHVRDLYTTVNPDPGKFKEWTPALRDAAYQETVRSFQGVVQNDESILTLLDAPTTYLNHDLAEFYGIPGVLGPEMRRVTLPNKRRGGVLTQAAVLTLTSYPQRTSPVLRGKWILEEVLGTPAPPPARKCGNLGNGRPQKQRRPNLSAAFGKPPRKTRVRGLSPKDGSAGLRFGKF